jgi:hypothetical protein
MTVRIRRNLPGRLAIGTVLVSAALFMLPVAASPALADPAPTVVSFDLGQSSWTVPDGVEQITVTAEGADALGLKPGRGARIVATATVVPGQVLTVEVANGPLPGGGSPGAPNAGGGYSGVLLGATPLVIAGGGGGTGMVDGAQDTSVGFGGDAGSPGGGARGSVAGSTFVAGGGGAGTLQAGGGAGQAVQASGEQRVAMEDGEAGAFLRGGAGGIVPSGAVAGQGGGGGGGYFGGGGGAIAVGAGGGAGGSSYPSADSPSVSSFGFTQQAEPVFGSVAIAYEAPVGATPPAGGDSGSQTGTDPGSGAGTGSAAAATAATSAGSGAGAGATSPATSGAEAGTQLAATGSTVDAPAIEGALLLAAGLAILLARRARRHQGMSRLGPDAVNSKN